MEERFNNAGRIKKFTLTGRIKPTDVPEEGNLFLELETSLGKLNLECFIYDKEPKSLHSGNLKVNDLVKIKFIFSSGIEGIRKTRYSIKKIVPNSNMKYNPIRGNIDYTAYGEILKIYPHPDPEMSKVYVRLIVDCGIYIHTSAPNNLFLKVGDSVQVNGRLDAHIIGKIESRK